MKQVIDYWNTHGLCSAESSTSRANPDWAHWANVIEKRRLLNELKHRGMKGSVLDIGAGLGRFFPVWEKLFSEIVMIEPANSLYDQLCLFNNDESTQCFCSTFESFVWSHGFDLLFASGVLYFLDSPSTVTFMRECGRHSLPNSLLVIRDFVSPESSIALDSTYVPDSKCYYRNIHEWTEMSAMAGWKLQSIYPSKPHYRWLHNWVNTLRLQKGLRAPGIPEIMSTLSRRHLLHGTINTVFLVFTKGQRPETF